MNGMLHPLQYDHHAADHQRRVEENLRLYRLFHTGEPRPGAGFSARWLARWGGVGGALQLLWALAFGFARYKA